MRADQTRFASRVWDRVRFLSRCARERVEGVPIRVGNHKKGLPIPPPHLLHLVSGTEDVARFLGSGGDAVWGIREILATNGLRLEDFEAILDFGCGAGRVLRHMADVRGPSLHGADYNDELIAWCRRNLGFAEFQTNGPGGGIAGPSWRYDFVYALSVFTQLSEALQFSWIRELSRVLRPGGHLLLTTQGEHDLPRLTADEQARFRRGELVVRVTRRKGCNDCATFHPPGYVREKLAKGFTVVDFLPQGVGGLSRQDVYLLKKDPSPLAT